MRYPEQFETEKIAAQRLANLYHRPYYVIRGRFAYWTTAAWPSKKGKSYEVLPTNGKVDSNYF